MSSSRTGTLMMHSTPATPMHIQQHLQNSKGSLEHQNIYSPQPTGSNPATLSRIQLRSAGGGAEVLGSQQPQQQLIAVPVSNTHPNHGSASSNSSSCDYAGGGGGARSSGDGGSSVGHGGSILGAGDSNYATLSKISELRNCGTSLVDPEEEESSHYSLIRRPDGQADEPNYSSIRESDAGYESLQVAAAAASSGGGNSNPSYGIDTPQVRDQVYETLRGVAGVTGGHYANATASLNRRTPTAPAKRNHTVHKTGIVGLPGFSSPRRSRRGEASNHPSGNDEAMALYARVDPAKKKKNRESGSDCASSPGSNPCSPIRESAMGVAGDSPTKNLIQKFDRIGLTNSHHLVSTATPPGGNNTNNNNNNNNSG